MSNENTDSEKHSILVTGAGGYIGHLVVEKLADDPSCESLVAADIALPPEADRVEGAHYVELDIRSDRVAEVMTEHDIDTVIHLAAIVTPSGDQTRQFQYDVDVNGTENILEACLSTGVERFIYTSSGAAYGYHPDNPDVLNEDDELRGNEAFAYAHHKKLVEKMLARYRNEHPELEQVIFRVSTILGPRVDNQITALFEQPVVLGLKGAESPFCIIWDRDVVDCLTDAVTSDTTGVFNLTGDGVVNLPEIAERMERLYIALPSWLVQMGLTVLNHFDLVPYGPEQTMFLEYRPVLSNDKLKDDFGFNPTKTSDEVFELYRKSRM